MSTCASSNRRRGRGVDGNWLINWRLYLILIDDNGDNAGRICKRSEIWCPKCYWLHLAFSDSMMTADSNCKKSERGTQMYIQRIRRFWYTTRLPPSAVHLSPAHTIRFNMVCCRYSEMLKRSIFTFWFLPNQNVSSIAFILLCGCASAHGNFVQVSQDLRPPESNFIKWQTASEFESVCRVRWIFKVQQDYVKVRAQIEHTHSNRFLGGGCQGNGFLNHNCREGKKNNLDEVHKVTRQCNIWCMNLNMQMS